MLQPRNQHTNINGISLKMVQIKFQPLVGTDKIDDKARINVLPVTLQEADRKRNDGEKVLSFISFLGTCLMFIGFIMILFSIKSVWDLKIENWRLIKENAALKKAVKDNVSVEKFAKLATSEDDILEFERPVKVEDPNISWRLSIQIFWSSPYITPCNMHWLARELAAQIYQDKKAFDQMKEINEDFEKIESTEAEKLDNLEVVEVINGGPYEIEENSGFEDSEDAQNLIKNDQLVPLAEYSSEASDLYFGRDIPEEKEIVAEIDNKVEAAFNDIELDLNLDI